MSDASDDRGRRDAWGVMSAEAVYTGRADISVEPSPALVIVDPLAPFDEAEDLQRRTIAPGFDAPTPGVA